MLASGALAQLGEHQLCKLGVAGSSPARSTFEAPANAGVSSQTETPLDPCPQNVRAGLARDRLPDQHDDRPWHGARSH